MYEVVVLSRVMSKLPNSYTPKLQQIISYTPKLLKKSHII